MGLYAERLEGNQSVVGLQASDPIARRLAQFGHQCDVFRPVRSQLQRPFGVEGGLAGIAQLRVGGGQRRVDGRFLRLEPECLIKQLRRSLKISKERAGHPADQESRGHKNGVLRYLGLQFVFPKRPQEADK